jgi:60 kDa SS-A/Ro ribonucleoprotein
MGQKNLASHVSTKTTPQSEPVHGKVQVENNAGGYVFKLDPWKQLDRFLILGSEGGTYYVSEKELTQENAAVVRACLALDPKGTVEMIRDVSVSGRAPKNEPAILALAIAAKTPASRFDAYRVMHEVCRIGTHLFHFAEYVKALGGWGRSTRDAFARWYTNRSLDSLALQVVKYQRRDGWSHRDVLCKAHPFTEDKARNGIFEYVVKGAAPESPHPLIGAVEEAKALTKKESLPRLIELVTAHGLPHECVPNEQKKHPELWEAMLPSMGLTAVVRNLAKMTNVGLLKPLGKANGAVLAKLADVDAMKRQRVHPMALLIALKQYEKGHGDKGKLSWVPVPAIVDALNDAFYAAFDAVIPSGKATLVGVDVSGSMAAPISGSSTLSCCDAATAMAMLAIRTEPNSMAARFNTGMQPLTFTKKTRLDDALEQTRSINGGGTDCSLPMLWALVQKIQAEVFWVVTDNETWAGKIHPFQALRQYREKTGINAKLVVMGMASTGFTIADPSDAGMMDVVGFDAAVPPVVADFAR